MIPCPECNGKGFFWLKINMPYQPLELKKEICTLCNGEGKITKLELAVYNARGGPPSVKPRRYS